MDRPAVVLDVGSHTCRAGMTTDSEPQLTLRTVTGRHPNENDIYSHFKPTTICNHTDAILTGDELTCNNSGHLIRKYPVSRGVVTDWFHMQTIIDHIYGRLKVRPEDQPIFLTEPPYNPKSNREEAAEILFEHYHVPAFHMSLDTPLILPGLGRTSGVAVSCGDGVTSVVSVYEGFTFQRSGLRQDFGGRDICLYLGQLLMENGSNIISWATGLEILRKMKESTVYAAVSNTDDTNCETSPVSFTLPDGQTVAVGEERHRSAEVIFHSSLIGKEYAGLHTLIHDSIQLVDIDCRRELYRNVVLAGGTAKLAGLSDRVHHELGILSPEKVKIGVAAPSQCDTAVWCGAANLAGHSTFESQWVTKQEFEESGSNAVHKKCLSFT